MEEDKKQTLDILNLPDEVLAIIFSYLDAVQLVRDVSSVCQRFRDIILSDLMVWRNTYFTWDSSNPDSKLFHQIVNNSPSIQCIRIHHPGSAREVSLLTLFKDIVTKHSKIRTVELKSHDPVIGYGSNLINGLHVGCGQTLRHLRLSGPLLIDAVPSLLKFSLISTLELFDTWNVTGKDLRNICDHCPALSFISLPVATYIMDHDLEYFFEKKYSMLVGFDMSGYMITDRSMMKLCHAPCLTHLSLRDARNINWGTFSMLKTLDQIHFVRLRRLRVIGLALTSWLSASRNLKHLLVLDLQYGYYLGDTVALMISFFCPNLRYLYMGGVPTVSKYINERVRENLPNLLYFCCDLKPVP